MSAARIIVGLDLRDHGACLIVARVHGEPVERLDLIDTAEFLGADAAPVAPSDDLLVQAREMLDDAICRRAALFARRQLSAAREKDQLDALLASEGAHV